MINFCRISERNYYAAYKKDYYFKKLYILVNALATMEDNVNKDQENGI
jgi:hypothetical protein